MSVQSPSDPLLSDSGIYPLPSPADLLVARRAAGSADRGPSRLDLLFPLSELLAERPDVAIRHLDADGDSMPEPYRSLLVHDQDMTSTLETHHGEPLELCRLETRRPETGHSSDRSSDDRSSDDKSSDDRFSDGALWRQVLLVGTRSGEIREAGAIRIDLRLFDTAARWEVLEGQKPLGAILADHRVEYESRPRLFFGFEASAHTDRLLGLQARGLTLYGRQNVLSTPRGVLAEVVEILPPAS